MNTKMRSRRRRSAVATATAAMLLASIGWSSPVVRAGAIISVTTLDQEVNGDADCSLQEAIYAANLDDNIAPDAANPGAFFRTGCAAGTGSGADTINLLPPFGVFTFAAPVDDPGNYVGPTGTPIVTSAIHIEGSGARIVHGGALVPFRAFAVADSGSLSLREVHIRGFEVWGGNGANGGGGGMGAGGAVYVHGGSLVVEHSTFEQNGALGGDGGGRREVPAAENFDVGGGGGGLGGNGGSAVLGGGGGGGARGLGGSGNIVTCTGGFFDCAFGFGGAGGGTLRSGSNGSAGDAVGGRACGGAGAGTQVGDSGHGGACRGGGGGGGNSGLVDWDFDTSSFLLSQAEGGGGGGGAYGGGGGGGGWGSTLVLSRGTDGGHGGFGGGGGGAGGHTSSGGDGGFGGGGGAGDEGTLNIGGPGQGGTFAGDGGGFYGGGGAGLGGAIFGHEADITIVNSTFVNNYAYRGRYGGGDANDGRDAGGAIFTVGGTLIVESSTIAGNTTGDPDGLGGGGIVVYDPIGDVEASLVLHNTILAGNGQSECYTRNGVTTTGSAGNLITDSSRNNRGDGDPPCPGVVEGHDPGLEPLALNKPGRTMTMKIPADSFAVDKAVGTSPQIDQRLILRPQGEASDIGAYEAAIIPPVTAITLDPAAPDGSNGWYRQSVGVAIIASDVDGTVAQTRCALDPAVAPGGFGDLPDAACVVSTVGADGQHALYAGSIDADGNVESPLVTAAFKVDATPPSLLPTLNVTPVVLGQTGVAATPNASDVLSGLASSSCGAIDTSTPGVHTVNCTATDNAGNTGSAPLTYVVEYRILGFYEPVPGSRWMVGQTVPVKVALGDLAGTRISDVEGAALAAACRVKFSASGAQTKPSQCMKYDALKDQFIYNWKLGKHGTGQATIVVRISYPDTSVTTQLSESITITIAR
jgi:CSLREA domain-containing protein